jgi:hypothetical protein
MATATASASSRDCGLFYMDTINHGVTMVNTVADNQSSYTKRDYLRAALARKIQKMMGRPSTFDFLRYVDNNLLPNCPITRQDIMTAEHVFGPNVGSLKGKTVHQPPNRVQVPPSFAIPANITRQYRDIVVAADIMYVNQVPFLVSISRSIKFCSAELLLNRQVATIHTGIKRINSL